MVLRHRLAAPFAAALTMILVTAACGGAAQPGGDPPQQTQRVPEPPAEQQPDSPPDELPEPPEPEPAPAPAPEYAPAEIAELVCEDVLYNAPPAPYAESGDPDDEMALVETMHADMLDEALGQMQPAPELDALAAVMVEMSDLSRRAAIL